MVIEKIILDYLTDVLDVEVCMEEHSNMPVSYVLIEKTGGGRENYIHSAVVAIQSYSTSKLSAAELNERVKDAMDHIVELDVISRAALNSDYPYPDTVRKKYRYQAVYDLVHY